MRKLAEPGPVALSIREMVLEDLERVMEVERRAFRNPWSAELLKRELDHDWSTILLAEQPGPEGRPLLLGLCIFWVVHDEVHILNVATDPAHQRRGVARRLMEETLARGRLRRCTLATLEVRRTNTPAIGLYQAFGFRPVGVRPNYYADEGEDALVMVLDL